ncbi:MAG: nucleotidyltransferase domain-containing protein [Myxococcota bacterium]
MELQEIESRVRAVVKADSHDVVVVYLYGSIARGSARPGSDVDIAVLLRASPEPRLGALCLDLEGALETELGVPVDLVVLNTAHPELVHRVLLDGVLVLERDRSERIRFEVRARNEYFDLKPRLDEYRRIRQGPA